MDLKIVLILFVASFAAAYGFGVRDFLDYLLGGGYGHYPHGHYPSGPGYGGYPGGGYGGYPGSYHPPGPPGAHPGCPLCDSSVYSYCSYKQAHDSCCCDGPSFLQFGCRKSDCNFLHAQSCQEYQLISNCCCVDVQRNASPPVAQVPVA